MTKTLPIFVGFDPRESVAYHVFCQSIIETSSIPVSFIPLTKKAFPSVGRGDGSNDFTYLRFLVPELMGYKGWALFAYVDMLCKSDIKELFDKFDETKAVMVVKHDYKTRFPIKYLGQRNDDYPRKNWSSVVLWNCGHPLNNTLSIESIKRMTGSEIHRFNWLSDDLIGDLPMTWNWLVQEYPRNDLAKLLHYTIGIPAFAEYKNTDHAAEWIETAARMNYIN